MDLFTDDPRSVADILDGMSTAATEEREPEAVAKKAIKKPAKFVFNKDRAFVIVLLVFLVVATALSLTIYFLDKKQRAAIRIHNIENSELKKQVQQLQSRNSSAESASRRYCEEAQRLRARVSSLEQERERLQERPARIVTPKEQKGILNEQLIRNHEERTTKAREADNDEGEESTTNSAGGAVEFEPMAKRSERSAKRSQKQQNATTSDAEINLDSLIEEQT